MSLCTDGTRAPVGVPAVATAIDTLAALDPAGVPDAVLTDALRELWVQCCRLAAEFSRLLAGLDARGGATVDGAPSTSSWLRGHTRMAPSHAQDQIRVARLMQRLPEVEADYRAGRIAYAHMVVIARTAETVGPHLVARVEDVLAEAARRMDPRQLRILAARIRSAVDPDGDLADSNAAHDRRRLHLSETFEGCWALDALLDPEGGAMLRTALEAVLTPPRPGDDRTPAQRRADALVELATGQLRHGPLPEAAGERPHLSVTIDAPSLLGAGVTVPNRTGAGSAADDAITPSVTERKAHLRLVPTTGAAMAATPGVSDDRLATVPDVSDDRVVGGAPRRSDGGVATSPGESDDRVATTPGGSGARVATTPRGSDDRMVGAAPQTSDARVATAPRGSDAEVATPPGGSDDAVATTPGGTDDGMVGAAPQTSDAGVATAPDVSDDQVVGGAPRKSDDRLATAPRGSDAGLATTPDVSGHAVATTSGRSDDAVATPPGGTDDGMVGAAFRRSDAGVVGAARAAAAGAGGGGMFDWGGHVHAETARRIACDAAISRVLLDPAGQPLDVGRRTRIIPPALRRALTTRDQGCRFTGCDRPPAWTDAHHVQHWIHGGPTSLSNLVLLCRHHHRLVHEGGWVIVLDHGKPIFLRPDGSILKIADP